MVFLGKNLNMSIVASMGYFIEVVDKEGQGVLKDVVYIFLISYCVFHLLFSLSFSKDDISDKLTYRH